MDGWDLRLIFWLSLYSEGRDKICVNCSLVKHYLGNFIEYVVELLYKFQNGDLLLSFSSKMDKVKIPGSLVITP